MGNLTITIFLNSATNAMARKCGRVMYCYTSHRHKLSFFDGRLDDNNMMDVTTEMIPFASLSPLRLRVKSRTRRREGAKTRKNRNPPVVDHV